MVVDPEPRCDVMEWDGEGKGKDLGILQKISPGLRYTKWGESVGKKVEYPLQISLHSVYIWDTCIRSERTHPQVLISNQSLPTQGVVSPTFSNQSGVKVKVDFSSLH